MKYAVLTLIATLLSVGALNGQETLSVLTIRLPQIVEQKVHPLYPAAAFAEKLVANGAADVSVDEHGFPTAVSLVSWENLNREGGARGLDEATVAAIRQWRFKPMRVEGKFASFSVRIGFVVRPDSFTYTTSAPEPLSR